jgi:tetratricopeptide (TPR) repeat protein
MRKVLEIKLRVMQMPPVTQYDRRELAIAYSNLGVGLLDNHDFESALENFHVAGRLFESLVAADPDNAEIRTTMTNNTRRIAETLGKLKRYAEASATYQRVIGTYRDLAGKDPGNAALQARLGQAYIGLSVMQSTAGNGPAAVQAAGQAEKIFEPLGAADPASHQLLARAYFQSGKGEELSGNWAAARGWYRRSLDLWRELQSKGRLPASNAPLLMRTEEALAVSEKKLAAAAQTAR